MNKLLFLASLCLPFLSLNGCRTNTTEKSDPKFSILLDRDDNKNALVHVLRTEKKITACIVTHDMKDAVEENDFKNRIIKFTQSSIDKWYNAIRFHPSIDSNAAEPIIDYVFIKADNKCDYNKVNFEINIYGSARVCSQNPEDGSLKTCRAHVNIYINEANKPRYEKYSGEMHLFSNDFAGDLITAHEFGHLLGLGDLYYEEGAFQSGINHPIALMGQRFHTYLPGNIEHLAYITDDDRLGLYAKLDLIDGKKYACPNNYIHDASAQGRAMSRYCVPNQLGKIRQLKDSDNKNFAYAQANTSSQVLCKIPLDKRFEVTDKSADNQFFQILFTEEGECVDQQGNSHEFAWIPAVYVAIDVEDNWVQNEKASIPQGAIFLSDFDIEHPEFICNIRPLATIRIVAKVGNYYRVGFDPSLCESQTTDVVYGLVETKFVNDVKENIISFDNIIPYGLIHCEGGGYFRPNHTNRIYCEKSEIIKPPFTALTVSLCATHANGKACSQEGIHRDVFIKILGNQECQMGSEKDRYTGYCTIKKENKNLILGPMHEELQVQCKTLFPQQAILCSSLTPPLEFVKKSLEKKMQLFSENYYPDEPSEIEFGKLLIKRARFSFLPYEFSADYNDVDAVIKELIDYFQKHQIKISADKNSHHYDGQSGSNWEIDITFDKPIEEKLFMDTFEKDYMYYPDILKLYE